ncbi:MAG: hypothetical protein ABR549_06530 [Mycobacteriales bacterium]
MPPYARDAGMTQREAERLALTVERAVPGVVTVVREGRYFVIAVETSSGRHTLRDEADWSWLQGQIQRG